MDFYSEIQPSTAKKATAVRDVRPYSTKRLDLTGQRFGKLTVVSRAENIGRDTAWRCVCDCGRETVARTSYLRRGITRSCGCDDPESRLDGTKRLDLTGRRFGKLVAVEPAGKSGGTCKWRCVCDCGGECVAAVANLRNGHTRSCGCESKLPMEGLHFVDGTNVEMIRSETIRSNDTSGVTGVTWRKRQQRWCAEIGFQKKRYFLGLYVDFEDAVKARRKAEERYFGEFLAEYDAQNIAF